MEITASDMPVEDITNSTHTPPPNIEPEKPEKQKPPSEEIQEDKKGENIDFFV